MLFTDCLHCCSSCDGKMQLIHVMVIMVYYLQLQSLYQLHALDSICVSNISKAFVGTSIMCLLLFLDLISSLASVFTESIVMCGIDTLSNRAWLM